MDEKPKYLTLTLAKVYAGQGKIEKALEIARELLKTDPENKAVKKLFRKLAGEKTAAMEDEGSNAARRLPLLFQEWFDLMLRLDRLRKLKRASLHTSGISGDTLSTVISKLKADL